MPTSNLTQADRIRQAAALMRERADAATNVTGASDWWAEARQMHFAGEWGVRSSGGFVSGDSAEEEAEHIATANPDVMRGISVLLGSVAEHLSSHECEAYCEIDGCAISRAASFLADVYLAGGVA